MKKLTPDDVSVIRKLRNENRVKVTSLASQYGVTRKQIHWVLKHDYRPRMPGVRYGGRLEKVERNRAVFDALPGHKYREIAEMFGVSKQRVHQILTIVGVKRLAFLHYILSISPTLVAVVRFDR